MGAAYDAAVAELPRFHAAIARSQQALSAAQAHADAAALRLRQASNRCREHPSDLTTGVHDIEQRMHARSAAQMAFEVARHALTVAACAHLANEQALYRHLTSLSAIRERAA
jgi:hypothetical protein